VAAIALPSFDHRHKTLNCEDALRAQGTTDEILRSCLATTSSDVLTGQRLDLTVILAQLNRPVP